MRASIKRQQSPMASSIRSSSFFNFTNADPRIDYDRFSVRWFLSCEYFNLTNLLPNILSVAVSPGDITPATQWSFYTFSMDQINPNGLDIDYNSPALDQNAYYNSVGVLDINSNFMGPHCW